MDLETQAMQPEMAPPWLDPRGEVMAEKRRVGVHPGEALAEMREKGHARHRIQGKI